jgi:hypothetical protein
VLPPLERRVLAYLGGGNLMMKKILIVLLVCAPFVYAFYHKPSFRIHREEIYRSAAGADQEVGDDFFDQPVWDDLSFADWFIFTATRDRKLSTLVSIGLADHVFVVDSDWAQNEFKLKSEILR